MTPSRSEHTTLSRFVAIAVGVVIVGCNPSSDHSPLPSGRSSTTTNSTPGITRIPLGELLGTWNGTAYLGRKIIADESPAGIEDPGKPSPPEESALAVKVDFLLEVEEKFLSIEGVETCHLTLFYVSGNPAVTSNRDFYRMIPDVKVPALITLRGSGGEFQIRMREDGQIELRGNARLAGVDSMLRNLHATLIRSDDHPAGSSGSVAGPPEQSATEK